MRLVLITLIALFGASNAWAHHRTHVHPGHLDQHLYAVYAYPSQVIAAAKWRHRHPHIDISLHLHSIERFGWHPSVVALLYHPHFLAQIHLGNHWDHPIWYGPKYKHHRHDKRYKKHWRKHWKHSKHRHKHHKKRVYVYER